MSIRQRVGASKDINQQMECHQPANKVDSTMPSFTAEYQLSTSHLHISIHIMFFPRVPHSAITLHDSGAVSQQSGLGVGPALSRALVKLKEKA